MTTDLEKREANKRLLVYFFTHLTEIVEAGEEAVKEFRTKESVLSVPFGGMAEPVRTEDYGWPGMTTVPNTFKFWRHEIVNIFDCLDPDTLWVEADAVSRTRTLDLDYHQRYVCCFTFRDGKLEGNKEYFNGDDVLLLMRELQHQARWTEGTPAD